ncbi:MAG: LysR family transcriptional regulator [Hungatella sp.]|nr:LysR family transcriptional regulator [Hungatella sp.]
MDIKNLDTFIQAAELNSFTKAAKNLGFSQSTVSFQIKQLEKSLNTQLFERINHTVSLTDRGREVLEYAHQILRLSQEMEKQLQSRENVSGHVRIAMADSLCSWLLKDDFGAFRRRFPQITLKIISASTEEMFRLLNQNEADMVYTLDNHIYDHAYIIASEEKVKSHFVAAPSYAGLAKASVSIRELVSFPFLLTEKGMSYRRLMDEKLAAMSLAVCPVLETGNANLICRLVEQNMGVSFLPDYVTRESVETGRLCYLPIDGFEIDIWQQLFYRHDKWVSPQMQAVIDYLAAESVRRRD